MASKSFETNADEINPGAEAERSIPDEAPDVYGHGPTGETYETYEAWVQQVKQDKSLSPKEQATLIASAPVPPETYEERVAREN